MLHQVMSLTLLASMSAAVPAVPQGIPRGATITGQSRGAAQATRVFVGNPYVAFPTLADSSAAVIVRPSTVGASPNEIVSRWVDGS